ncbi:hypothetical protein LSH36_339g04009 [Paralvinella palmiformis]|uniref:Exportin 6 n=1 Tax=Paralvinella palmiformis TaxID=53620 RepID=A0AAD9N015_9ANNE|nr:hypothetical protein LSH36_339g04009 [Paralvinella palmiformis]
MERVRAGQGDDDDDDDDAADGDDDIGYLQASDAESLHALENLMTEFFSVSAKNERKREIEELLNNFSQQRDAWKHCFYFMTHSHNQYVIMYSMNVLEKLINHQWVGLQAADKMEIRTALNTFLLNQHNSLESFLRNKLIKLVVDIGRLDWPHFYPDFFSSILQLVQQPDTCVLGLILLHTTSEELACPREDLCMSRKAELQRLLLQQIPTVLSLLNGILSSILERHRSMVTATPPPSPTQNRSQMTLSVSPVQSSVISSSPVQSRNLVSNLFKSPQSHVQTESLPPLDAQSQYIAHLALNCLSHLFSWIPLSTTITPALLSTVFHYAAFGCEVSPGSRGDSGAMTKGSPHTVSPHTLGVLAMGCINELLSKNCVPQEFEDFLLQMFQQTFYLLQRITKDSTTNSSGNRLAELDDVYVEKFTDFLQLFVSIHLRRFEANKHFPVSDFLGLFFRYTFKQPSSEGFFACLDTWAVFLDYLLTQLGNRTVDRDSILQKYHEPLSLLLTHILQKLQFKYNQSQLDELDDDTLDDDSETEWQHFLRQCLEIVAKVAELFPTITFQLLFQPFQENLNVYLGLEQFISLNGNNIATLDVRGENECRRLHCTLRDLSSLLQAMGRLADHFIGDKYERNVADAKMLMERLSYTAAYGMKVKLYEVQSVANSVLQADFIEVHAQTLATIKAFAGWLAQFCVESLKKGDQQTEATRFLTTLLDTVLALFITNIPEKMIQSAAHLLWSLLCTVRSPTLVRHDKLQQFYNTTSHGALEHRKLQVQYLVYRSLSHYLLLPWSGCTDGEQCWEMRATHHKQFIHQLFSSYLQLQDVSPMIDNRHMQNNAKPCVKKSLQMLTDIISSLAPDGTSRSKQICYQSVQDLIQVTLALFPVYLHMTDVTIEFLEFFLVLFDCLKVQMGAEFTKQIIQTFVSIFTREQLTEIILQESATGYKVIEKYLAILQVIVQEPGSSFKTFLPNVIAISMEQIYPVIAERPAPDIKPSLYSLLHQLLMHNWRYFYKSSVLHRMQDCTEDVENQEQFLSIMQAFGQSFLQPDIDVFRQNLEALQSLNQSWKLYSKKLFRDLMLFQFLNVLIQVLLHKSHDLLQEEITITIYNMASVDFTSFFETFLLQILNGCEGLDSNQKMILGENFKHDKDLPSFTQNVQRFVNDLRYYRLCNSSLPEGSIKL